MTANQELHITHTFDVTKETLFDMWTNPHHLKHWWAPAGFTVNVASIELTPGGIFHYSQTSTDDGVNLSIVKSKNQIDSSTLVPFPMKKHRLFELPSIQVGHSRYSIR